MRESQLTAAEIIKHVFEGNNLNKVFLNYSNKKNLSQIKDLVFGTLRSYGKTKFIIDKLVKRKPTNH